jgi:hypothetical protein
VASSQTSRPRTPYLSQCGGDLARQRVDLRLGFLTHASLPNHGSGIDIMIRKSLTVTDSRAPGVIPWDHTDSHRSLSRAVSSTS